MFGVIVDIIGNCVGKGFLYSINVDTGAGGGPILRADIFGSMAIASSTLQITSTSLPAVKLATNSSYQLKAIFGNPPYSWVVVGGTLPRGMALSSGGVIKRDDPRRQANLPLPYESSMLVALPQTRCLFSACC